MASSSVSEGQPLKLSYFDCLPNLLNSGLSLNSYNRRDGCCLTLFYGSNKNVYAQWI